MRLEENPQLPLDDNWRYTLQRFLRNVAQKVNQLGDGRINGSDLTLTAAPTTGQFQRGDFVLNSAPSELGTAGAKYVVFGWQCVSAGTPGTFVQVRYLTGN